MAANLPESFALLSLVVVIDPRNVYNLITGFYLSKGGSFMKKYICTVCGYVYDPANGDPDSGIAPGTAFEDIPEDWVCPVCGVAKDMFEVTE